LARKARPVLPGRRALREDDEGDPAQHLAREGIEGLIETLAAKNRSAMKTTSRL
jgi:hypothetical protein